MNSRTLAQCEFMGGNSVHPTEMQFPMEAQNFKWNLDIPPEVSSHRWLLPVAPHAVLVPVFLDPNSQPRLDHKSIIFKQLEQHYVCMSHNWLSRISSLSMKLSGALSASDIPKHSQECILLFSFLTNFISFSQKISKTCFLYVFVFLRADFHRKITMAFHFLFIPRGNRAK